MTRVVVVIYEGLLIAVASLLGWIISEHYRIIPTFIIHFPAIAIPYVDFRTTLITLFIINIFIFTINMLITRGDIFVETRRTSFEFYGMVLGFTLSGIYLFLFTEIIFSPEFLAATALCAFGLFALSFIVGQVLSGARGAGELLAAIGHLLTAIVRMLRSPAAIAIVLFALSPIIIAKAFVSSRDFANLVTLVRQMHSVSGGTKYQLTSAFPGVKFLQPIHVQFPPDGTLAGYVLERRGAIWRIGLDGKDKELLVDFSKRVGVVEVENGALGFALHPEFGQAASSNRGFVYVYYTDATTPGRQINRLVRFDLSLTTPSERAASEFPLIEFNRDPDGYHNAGSIEFGPDSFLYLAIGEGSDPENYQRIDRNLLGGIFRIDVAMRGGDISHPIRRQPKDGKTQNYFIPNENPFVGVAGALEEYWALGLRNPFRMSFDPRTGKLFAGDVGSDMWEEVNLIQKGGNYQFPYIEGVTPQPRYSKPDHVFGTEIAPVYYYSHTASDRAVIGGTVYRGGKLTELQGMYIFADDYSGRIWAFPADATKVDHVELLARSTQVGQFGVTTLVNGPTGDLFLTALGSLREPTGQVLRLVRAGTAPPQESAEVAPQTVAVDGREIFKENCAMCHGPTGDGRGPGAAGLPVKPADFTSPDYPGKRSEEQVEQIIHKGGTALGLNAAMPPWGSVDGSTPLLTDAEIRAVAKYVHTLARKN